MKISMGEDQSEVLCCTIQDVVDSRENSRGSERGEKKEPVTPAKRGGTVLYAAK